MNDKLLEPLKYYNETAKKLHQDNATAHFDALLNKSKVDVEQNRRTVKEYNKELAILNNLNKRLSKLKTYKVLLIILAVLSGISAFISIFLFSADAVIAGVLLGVGIILLVLSIVIIKIKLSPKIKALKSEQNVQQNKVNALLEKANAEVLPLKLLFTENDAVNLIEKTIPDFSFDKRYTVKNDKLFRSQHDFLDYNTVNETMTDTLSGNFNGNPFLFCEQLVHYLGTHTYHGYLTIYWTETERGSDGKIRTVRKSQTLHAMLTKPKPYYRKHNYLCYGNQAAPDLNFSRTPTDVEKMNEKQIEKTVKKGAKKLKKKTEKATVNAGNFQEMANTEFDVLFGATNRDHEVQFRLMYTPLAQQNTLSLMKDKVNFGDDFKFIKHKRFNVIDSEHAQGWKVYASPTNYYSHDVDEIRRKFIEFNDNYFKSIYFDFAPLFSIPAYLESPANSLEPIEDYTYNFTTYEHEVIANAIDQSLVCQEGSVTPAIIKSSLINSDNNKDTVSITAYTYTAIDRLDYVPMFGRDGRTHLVPVPWVEYIPLEKSTIIQIEEATENKSFPDGTTFRHGLASKIIN